MSRETQLIEQVRSSGALLDRLVDCRRRIGKMCSEGRPPRMSVPVCWDDDDWFISHTLADAAQRIKELETQLAVRNGRLDTMTAEEVPIADCPRLMEALAKR